jgi:Lon protease-like protein
VFEPRYRELVQVCLDGNQEFGVVLIERGSEVGGGDQRVDVGTVAQIVEATRMPDGRWALGTVGTRRIRVREWLVDDPYPQAEVDDWPEPELSADGTAELRAALDELLPCLRRVLAARSELGEPAAPATIELADDPALASYQATRRRAGRAGRPATAARGAGRGGPDRAPRAAAGRGGVLPRPPPGARDRPRSW